MSRRKEKEAQQDSSSDTPHTPGQPPTQQQHRGDKPSSSMASRIQDSASSLLRNATSGPGGHGLAADLSQSLANGNKAGPFASRGSAGSSSAAADTFHSHGASAGSSASSSAGEGAELSTRPESFRSGATAQGGFELDQLAPEDFERGHVDYLDTTRFDLQDVKGKGKQRETQFPDWDPGLQAGDNLSNFHTAWEGAHHATTTTQSSSIPQITEPSLQPTDGAAVVSLLSDPSFQPDLLPSSTDEDLDLDPIPQLTPAEIEIIDSFRRHPSNEEAETTQQTHRLTCRSLIPDIDTFLAQDSISPVGIAHGAGTGTMDTTTLRDTVLSHLPGAEDWMAVEDRYHDEVWGFLRPTLEAAKKEIDEKENEQQGQVEGQGHPDGDGPAVRRLRMILKHMQA
ncbi:hypothetical protein VTN00DRAFT_5350 [Thermoascus crustaceus]|uniref:uncharacterized protein n=1 Tax=Thermoascus crustaceus TaxID=5088 RepID=UPI0037444711